MAFENTWHRYYPRLAVYLQKGFHLSQEDAEDLAQETLLKIHGKRSEYDEKYAFSTWVYAVCRNTCIDFLRQNRRLKENEQAMEEADGTADLFRPGPEAALMRDETLRDITAAVGRLVSSHRELVYLRMYEELSYREISAITAKPTGTIKYRFSEIRKRIKQELGEGYEKRTGVDAIYQVGN